MRSLGEISYSTYLMHFPALSILTILIAPLNRLLQIPLRTRTSGLGMLM